MYMYVDLYTVQSLVWLVGEFFFMVVGETEVGRI